MSKLTVVTEQDIASKDHDVFAQAISKCKGYTPECIQEERCVHGGCFDEQKLPSMIFTDMDAEIERLQKENQQLRTQILMLESHLEAHIENLNGKYNSLRTALHENRRWAIHYARQCFIDLKKTLKAESLEGEP